MPGNYTTLDTRMTTRSQAQGEHGKRVFVGGKTERKNFQNTAISTIQTLSANNQPTYGGITRPTTTNEKTKRTLSSICKSSRENRQIAFSAATSSGLSPGPFRGQEPNGTINIREKFSTRPVTAVQPAEIVDDDDSCRAVVINKNRHKKNKTQINDDEEKLRKQKFSYLRELPLRYENNHLKFDYGPNQT